MRVYNETTEWKQNPLAKSKYRNEKCFCGSEKKIKKCCNHDFIHTEYLSLAKVYIEVLKGVKTKETYSSMIGQYNTKLKAEIEKSQKELQEKNEKILSMGNK